MRTFNRYATLSQLLREAPFTFAMLVINITVFVVEFLLQFFDISLFYEGALFTPFIIELGQYYRIITSAFLHGNIIHLGFNMFVGLYLLTAGLERIIGTKKTAAIYFLSMILASGVVIGSEVILEQYNATVGASGAIFGALGALLYISIYRHDLMHASERQWIIQLIVINLIFTFLVGNISIPGHVGGLASGYLISYLFIPREPKEIIYDSQDYWNRQKDDNDWYN